MNKRKLLRVSKASGKVRDLFKEREVVANLMIVFLILGILFAGISGLSNYDFIELYVVFFVCSIISSIKMVYWDLLINLGEEEIEE